MSRASWRRLRTPPPLLFGLRASLYWPNQMRDNRNGRLLYPVRAVRCYLDCFAAHRQRCEQFLFAAGCSTKELLKTIGSGCSCHGYAGFRLRNGLFVSLEFGALVLSLSLFFEKNFAVILVGGRVCGTRTHPCGAAT